MIDSFCFFFFLESALGSDKTLDMLRQKWKPIVISRLL